MDRDVFLFYHTHTTESNRFEKQVRDLDINTHATDYVQIVRSLPSGVDAVFVKTDHWKTDPAYFDRLNDRLSSEDVIFKQFDRHVYFEIGGSAGAIINGVETSVVSENKHVIIGGLPISDENQYYNLQVDELIAAGKKGSWIAPAHIGMPFHRIRRGLLSSIFEKAEMSQIDVAIGYATGYSSLMNHLSRNEVPFRTTVRELANIYDVPLIPELDLHGVLPDGYSGCGIVDSSTINSLQDGTLPIKKILAANLFRPPGYQMGITVWQLARNYATFIPCVPEISSPQERFNASIPDVSFFQNVNTCESKIRL